MPSQRVMIGTVLLTGCLLTATAGLTQQAGSTGAGGATTTPTAPAPTASPTPTPTPTRPPSPTPLPTTPQPSTTPTDRFPQDIPRPIFLSGKVILEDGTPPPDSVTIERVCNGVVRPEAYTDSKGRFSFQLGQANLFADASIGSNDSMSGFDSQSGGGGAFDLGGGGISERDLMGCEIRASLVGYRSDVVTLAGRRSLDRPEVGTIVLHRYANVPGTTISITSLAAPKDAVKAFNKGREAFRKEKWGEARKQFEKAVEAYPKYAAAWYELGLTLARLKDGAGASKAYQQAFSADERYLPPYIQLTAIAAQKHDWSEVVARTDQLMKLDPLNFPGVYLFNSIGQFNVQNMDAAEKSAREAIRLDTTHRFPDANRVLGVILALRGDLEGAVENLKVYLKLAPNASEAQMAKEQLAKIEQLAKTTPAASR